VYRERIRDHYDTLSKSQKRIADFLMTSQREAAFMTASRLATELDVDVATITRFAQRLDYPGYPELLDEVRTAVRAEMSAGFRPVEGLSEPGRVFVHALNVERENLERTLAAISIAEVERAVEALSSARAVYLIGMNTAVLLAQKLYLLLQMMDMNPVMVGGDTVVMSIALSKLSAEDVLVAIGYSSWATDTAAAMRIARSRGAKTIGISGSDVSPVSRVADIKLICSANSLFHIPSEISGAAIVEGLAQALYIARSDAYEKSMGAVSQTFAEMQSNHPTTTGSVQESYMKIY
jgi:DNA-binding MurR/RpiR family transcriptional regulator